MTTEQENEFRGGAWEHYLEAVKKHQKFAVKATKYTSLSNANEIMEEYKDITKYLANIGQLSFDTVVTMKTHEYLVAVLKGNREEAKRELLDMVAVLMREWERISDEKEVLA